MSVPIFIIFGRHYRKFAKSHFFIISPPNAFCVTALRRKTLIAILVLFCTAKNVSFILPNFLRNCHSNFTVFEKIKPDDYYLHVLSLMLTLESRLKLGLMLCKQMTHRCNNVQQLIVHTRWWQCWLVRHRNGPDLWPPNRTTSQTSAVTVLLRYFISLRESFPKLRFYTYNALVQP